MRIVRAYTDFRVTLREFSPSNSVNSKNIFYFFQGILALTCATKGNYYTEND